MSSVSPPLTATRTSPDEIDVDALEGIHLLQPIRTEITALAESLGSFHDAGNSASTTEPDEAATADYATRLPKYAKKDVLRQYIPSTDPSDPSAKTFKNRMSERQRMLRVQLGLAGMAVMINTSLLTWLWIAYPPFRATGTLFTGNCTFTSFLDSAVHLMLNVISTAFLGAGNYCMQVLVAPSRQEIEKAHASGKSLDIGKHSVHNAFHIHWKRRLIWVALATVSTVLHLIWNSTFFSSIPIVAYPAAIVTHDFLSVNDDWNKTNPASASVWAPPDGPYVSTLHQEARELQYMNNAECIASFLDPRNASRKLILVSNESSADQKNKSSLLMAFIGNVEQPAFWDIGSYWVCHTANFQGVNACTLQQALSQKHDWKVLKSVNNRNRNITIDYCLVGAAADMNALCGFHYSSYLFLAVCICTAVTSILIAWITFRHNKPTIVLVGDALESFLECPEHLPSIAKQSSYFRRRGNLAILKTRKWNVADRRPRWFFAVGKNTWLVSIVVLTAGVILGAGLFIWAVISLKLRGMPSSFSSWWAAGLGTVQIDGLIGGTLQNGNPHNDQSLGLLMFANSFQLLISFLYLFYNNILTCQLAAHEFVQYLTVKSSLRVSTPKNVTQQSSHFLSLPWNYAIPQMLSFVALHWLISQSVFIVQTTAFGPGPDGQPLPQDNSSRVGWSTVGVFLSMIWSIVQVLALLLNSFRRYPNVPKDILTMATNSTALSACCQRPPDDSDAHLYPVMLGIVNGLAQTPGTCAGRLTFTSSLHVNSPQQGTIYELPTWQSQTHLKKKKG